MIDLRVWKNMSVAHTGFILQLVGNVMSLKLYLCLLLYCRWTPGSPNLTCFDNTVFDIIQGQIKYD